VSGCGELFFGGTTVKLKCRTKALGRGKSSEGREEWSGAATAGTCDLLQERSGRVVNRGKDVSGCGAVGKLGWGTVFV